ncbi:hypothetical protein [Paenibacillus sp. 481]|uniref:hypothetical protein n=1 Tax=Paenibacillus sp. 481 TaxID=2835869 RepID=UPI001E58F3BF|nr:hypothetical protein [Paenibacillus sp. 481]UHA73304.1 hypothetical protein KIK04_22465 [Paenibacillus sp. 481]
MIKDRATWNKHTSECKEKLLRKLNARLPAGFAFLKMERFERFGLGLETGIFMYEGCEFVYVPGDRVTLGWAQWEIGPDEESKGELESGLKDLDRESTDLELEHVLRQQMSPVREVDIGPLLIERQTRPVAWYEVELADLDPAEDGDVLEAIERIKTSNYGSYEQHQSFRLDKEDGRIRIWLFADSPSQQAWAKDELPDGIDVLTEDEWEYVYGGGCRTIFPWGDSFDYRIKVRHFGEPDREQKEQGEPVVSDRPFDLEKSSGMGLHFLGDPYKQELTVSLEGLVRGKGGDGGVLICGGMGVTWGYLPVATYYRDPYEEELQWEDRTEYLHYRRVVRL